MRVAAGSRLLTENCGACARRQCRWRRSTARLRYIDSHVGDDYGKILVATLLPVRNPTRHENPRNYGEDLDTIPRPVTVVRRLASRARDAIRKVRGRSRYRWSGDDIATVPLEILSIPRPSSRWQSLVKSTRSSDGVARPADSSSSGNQQRATNKHVSRDHETRNAA